MNKELFIKAIEAIEKQNAHDNKVSEHLANAFPDAFQANLMPANHHLSNILFEILQTAMGDTFDKYGQSCIEYFCWELDFGRKNDVLKIYDETGKEFPLSNPNDLWELLNENIAAAEKELMIFKDQLISETDLSNRVKNIFKFTNVKTINDILKYSEIDLLRLPGCGRLAFNEIKTFVLKNNLQLSKKHY